MGGTIEAGVSSVPIAPRTPVYLAGLDRRSTKCELSGGVHDDIFAGCFLLRVGGRQIGFLTLDLIGFFNDDVGDFREFASRAGLKPEERNGDV